MPNIQTTREPQARNYWLRWILLAVLFFLIAALALTLGAPVPLSDLWSHDSTRVGVARAIFGGLRPTRVLAAVLVGAALSVSGASLQAVFRNALAEPYLLGISAGGALGATLGLAFNNTLAFDLAPILAFIGALGATAIVYVLGQKGGGAVLDRSHLLLCGVALSSFLAALMALVVSLSNRADIAQQVMFWMLGGLGNATPAQNFVLLFAFAMGFIALLGSARDLNALRLGDGDARALGVDVARVHRRLLVAAALMSAAAVSTAGLIGFVGLLAPHLMRQVFGDDARRLVPAAAIGGATLLVGCDAIARSILRPIEIPVGIVTALLGVPLFLFLARRV